MIAIAMQRYLQTALVHDVQKKMVFLGGPRQVGKTTLVQQIAKEHYQHATTYLNRDNIDHKKRIITREYNTASQLLIFDELHKYDDRKNFLKGEYDVHREIYHFLVTGSARLNIFQKGGDSLLGRYVYYRLHPYSLAEIMTYSDKKDPLAALLQFGGFPEPFHTADEREHQRRKRDRKMRLVREDIRDVTDIRHLGKLELLVTLLESKVGSSFSLNSLAEDVQMSYKTIAHWIDVLEYTYYLRRIYPYQSTLIRSLRKEPKMYLWDRSEVATPGARIENMIAHHVLKWVHRQQDYFGRDIDIRYVRDREGREVDIAVVAGDHLLTLLEVKRSDTTIDTSLRYFTDRLQPEQSIQVVYDIDPDYDRIRDGVRIVSAYRYLQELI